MIWQGRMGLGAALLLAVLAAGQAAPGETPAPAGPLPVYQELEEVTRRIGNLENKPYEALLRANGGFSQNETIIFKDVETGNEVWSLTRERCTDLANIERRTAWSCNGEYISFIGNMAFLLQGTGELQRRQWAGYSYVARADGTQRRCLWATAPDGKVTRLQDKFNNWDAARPNVLYYPDRDRLWRITLADSVTGSKAELVYTFPNAQLKIVQEISDSNFMLVEEQGKQPNCYVIDLNKEPKDPRFCLTYPLKQEVHPGSFRFRRSALIITGGYNDPQTGLGTAGPICLKVDAARGVIEPYTFPDDPYKMQMAHLWYGAPDDRVIFSDDTSLGGWGLWVHVPGSAPVCVARVADGHPTWCGHDPDWAFYAVGTGEEKETDARYSRRLLAVNADGKQVKVICTPFDRRRGGRAGYDAIPRPNQSPDATKCWFHSSMLMPSDEFTGSYIAVFRRPSPPTRLELAKGGSGVALQWALPRLSYERKGCHVYRSDDGGKRFQEVTREAVAGTTYRDASARPGRRYLYAVTCEEWSRLESDVTSPTLPVAVAADGRAQAGPAGKEVRGWDRVAPDPASGFTATRGADGLIRLAWKLSPTDDVRYYNVYASNAGAPAVSQKRLLVSPAPDQTAYVDWTADRAGAVHYAITAVDRQGNESRPAFATAAGGQGE